MRRALTIAALACSAAPAQDVYSATVKPFVAKYCLACHSDQAKAGNLSLATPAANWDRVADRLSTGRMPPLGAPRPPQAEIAAVVRWAEARTATTSDPGRVTSRRLNRAEYNNSVRDLLGLTLRPADEFPIDDAGYGFDTVGDVQTVSPLLMEKYIAAARKLSRVAVYGGTAPAKPTKLTRFMTRKSQDDPTPGALPFSLRGAIYGSFHFPVAGEYELRMRVGNYRPRNTGTPRENALGRKRGLTAAEKAELNEFNRKAYPPVRMVMTLDGKQILTEVVEGNIDYEYAHGESIARIKVTAGEHHFRASFPEFASLADPRDNMNLDGRRKLFIDYVDVVGPFTKSPPTPSPIFVCREETDACAESILRTLASRAYRRPVAPTELTALTGLAAMVRASGDTFAEGIRVATQAVLLSPNFLFRAEPANLEPQEVGDRELASRLAYFLWSSLPDEELTQAPLRRPGVLATQIKRMLADPKSDALIENFAGQWLGLRILDRRKPDPAHFPRFDDELLDAMRRETELFTRAILQENRSILEFIDGRFTFVNGPLARHYGIPGVNGEAFERVNLTDPHRGGLTTQGSVLTLSSYATRTSPVLRGHWVLETLLGTAPPPPPPGTPSLPEATAAKPTTLRARLEQHRANASCAVCHDQMDPIGFGLENFDASGAWRDMDGGSPIDTSGTFPGGAAFRGPEQLRRELRAQAPMFVRNLTEKMLTYALGRGIEPSDRKSVDTIVTRLAAKDYRMTVLIEEIASSPMFQMRGAAPPAQSKEIAHVPTN